MLHSVITLNSPIIIKFALLIEPSSGANNFVRPSPASTASIYLRDAWQGQRMTKRFIRAWRAGEKSRSESGRVAGTRSLSWVRTMSYRRLYLYMRRGAARRSVTRQRWEYEIVACVSARVTSHTYTICPRVRTHTVGSFLAVAWYLIFALSPLCWRGKS